MRKKKIKLLKRQNCEFIEFSDILPKEWKSWFYDYFGSEAPFSWGDNNRTLITAERVSDYIDSICFDGEECVPQEEIDEFSKKIRELGWTYIDLEN